MNSEDGLDGQVIYTNVNIADETLTAFSVGIKELFKKDDIEFFTEFPCLLGHPVQTWYMFNVQYLIFLV